MDKPEGLSLQRGVQQRGRSNGFLIKQMDRQIKIKITKDGKVEVDSSVFKDCMDVAGKLKDILGRVEKIDVKDETEIALEKKLKIERE